MIEPVLSTGRVVEWHDDDGWGLIDCPELDGPCWAHFSVVEMDGYRSLAVGTMVRLAAEAMDVDGYRYSATRVQPLSR
jgi:CspA family cold shock protein